MINRVILLSILLGLMVGCSTRKDKLVLNQSFESFPEVISLKGEGILLDEDQVLLRYPFRVRLYGDIVFIVDMHNGEEFFHIYEKESFRHVASFGRRGEGPQEMLQGQNLYVESLDSIWTLDPIKRQIIRWSFYPKTDSVSLSEVVQLDKQTLIEARDFTQYNDSTWLLPDLSGESRVCFIGKDGTVVGKIGYIPTTRTVRSNSLSPLAEAWNAYVHYCPQNQVLAVATQLGDVMEIYNLESGEHRIVYGPQGEPVYRVTSEGYAIPLGIMGYSDVQITSRYIYAVYHGTTFKEIMANPANREDGGRLIRVFGLDGTPIRCYQLDHAVYGIHVDEVHNVIWATDVNSEEQLVRFPLSSSFEQVADKL